MSSSTKTEPALRLEWRTPSELAENPLNWRTHPESQTAALSDCLDTVGWAGACLFNERIGRLIDGHARRKLGIEQGDEPIPVLVGDWSEEQERLILATLDPLADAAEVDVGKLDALLREVETSSEAVSQMIVQLAQDTGVVPPDFQPVGEDEQGKLDEKAKISCPECGHEFTP